MLGMWAAMMQQQQKTAAIQEAVDSSGGDYQRAAEALFRAGYMDDGISFARLATQQQTMRQRERAADMQEQLLSLRQRELEARLAPDMTMEVRAADYEVCQGDHRCMQQRAESRGDHASAQSYMQLAPEVVEPKVRKPEDILADPSTSPEEKEAALSTIRQIAKARSVRTPGAGRTVTPGSFEHFMTADQGTQDEIIDRRSRYYSAGDQQQRSDYDRRADAILRQAGGYPSEADITELQRLRPNLSESMSSIVQGALLAAGIDVGGAPQVPAGSGVPPIRNEAAATTPKASIDDLLAAFANVR